MCVHNTGVPSTQLTLNTFTTSLSSKYDHALTGAECALVDVDSGRGCLVAFLRDRQAAVGKDGLTRGGWGASPTLTLRAQAEAGEERGLGLAVFPTPTLLGLE